MTFKDLPNNSLFVIQDHATISDKSEVAVFKKGEFTTPKDSLGQECNALHIATGSPFPFQENTKVVKLQLF